MFGIRRRMRHEYTTGRTTAHESSVSVSTIFNSRRMLETTAVYPQQTWVFRPARHKKPRTRTRDAGIHHNLFGTP